MSSMTVSQILELYHSTVGETTQSSREAWVHLNNGYRRVIGELEIPELVVPDATVDTVAGQDWVEHDCGAFAIDYIVDTSNSHKLYREPEGMRGRAFFFEDGTTKPPSGRPHHYERAGNKIWLRDTPPDVRTLLISFRMQAPELSSANLDDHLVTPEQYDFAVVYAAASSCLKIHPPMVPSGDGFRADREAWREMDELMMSELVGQKSPTGLENRDRRQTISLRGYRFAPPRIY